MVRGAAVGVALVLAVGAAGCGGTSRSPSDAVKATSGAAKSDFHGTAVLDSAVATDFALRDQNDRVVRLSAERGKFVLMTFLYTNCPDICPLIASNLNQTLRGLSPVERRDTRVIAVSADPVHDTSGAVQRYVVTHRLVPQFHYLIGSVAELKPVWQAYNVLVEPRNGERVSHSTYVLLIDRRGRPRLYYSPQVTSADLLVDLRRLMRHGV